MSTSYCTTIGVVDGMAWFEDGTSVDNVTVELIRAAPDLLAALWEIYHHAYDPETSREDLEADFDRMRDIAHKAIAKAKGGE